MKMCKESLKDKKIVLHDHKGKTRMCFTNPNAKKLEKWKVDGCIITSGSRCDFLIIDHCSVEHYVELKGKNVKYACEQIEATIKALSAGITKSKHAFVVSTACPLTTTEVQILKATFRKQYNSSLIVKNIFCEHLIC